jgi:hypothetical protein
MWVLVWMELEAVLFAVLPTPGKTLRPDQPKLRPLAKNFGPS